MPIRTPSQLVEEYKRSGEYDRLRRKILEDFENGSSAPAFLEKVEEIARKRVATDYRVKSMAPEMAHKELMQEIARYVCSGFSTTPRCTL
ncbi:hypothetical protein PUNSTDRAFT_51030 [Punctularia strigosozonata HHB-11173 SS5]|uniref:uncharacterized protein n=1 Tax=Punctularia strigosozonata (strain HHB-11173) TaxID=741275 RepID=UPI00044171DB|nr:uncharacterized protein PUNSTDRAFT_51030 [Punctularia strigosozonata HHB-11173 SS5]EIN10382.1 hypothetical protein PUNSTDRAFT_51030 [Punctularia strigosozonata HHB-11173 SS5]